MLTLQNLKDMPCYEVFATGIVPNSPEGIFATRENPNELIRWVACRGKVHDWAIYYHWAINDKDWVVNHGLKLYNPDIIKKLVSPDDKAFDMYRF